MLVTPYASDAKILATEALIGQRIAESTTDLYQQIVIALANRNAVGGDPYSNVTTALGGSPLGDADEILLKQMLVLVATA